VSRHQSIEEDLRDKYNSGYMGDKCLAHALTEMARLRSIESAWELLVIMRDHHKQHSTSSESYRHGMCETIEEIFEKMDANPPRVFTDDDF